MDSAQASTKFKNGNDIHFDYGGHAPHANDASHNTPATLSSKKKKKKKKKGKSSAARNLSVENATLNDPDADYPESRVIKVGPNGDVIVESLEDEYPPEAPQDIITARLAFGNDPFENSHKLEQAMIKFRDEGERDFWKSLPEEKRRQITSIDVDTINERFKQQKKLWSSRMQHNAYGDHPRGDFDCSCHHCERNSMYVQEELANVYQPYLEEFVRSGLYFPETSQPQEPLRSPQPPPEQYESEPESKEPELEHQDGEDYYTINEMKQRLRSHFRENGTFKTMDLMTQLRDPEDIFGYSDPEFTSLPHEAVIRSLAGSLPQEPLIFTTYEDRLSYMRRERDRLLKTPNLSEMMKQRIAIDDFLLQDIDRARLIEDKAPVHNLHPEVQRIVYAETFEKILGQSKTTIPKFLENFYHLKAKAEFYPQVKQEMAAFADMILKNDGKSFVDIVEAIKLTQDPLPRPEEIDEDDPELEHYALKEADDDCGCEHEHDGEHDDGYVSEYDHEYDHDGHCDEDCDHHKHSYDEEDYDYEHDDHEHGHSCSHDHDHGDLGSENEDYDDESDLESEHAKQERIKELRGFFMIQAIHVIRQRFREAYEKKLSEDRTQKFIEELEAEENAKKERELKKLKQKEKQQEKKRLQKLAKEEEKKKKEAEELAREIERKKKEEELRAEQLRRKEELRLKREEEKARKIEAIKKKELEQKRAQENKRNEEALKAKAEKEALEKAKQEEEKCQAEVEALRVQVESLNREQEKAVVLEQAVEASWPPGLSNPVPMTPANAIPDTLLNAIDEDPSFSSDAFQQTAMDLGPRSSPTKNHLLEQLYQARPRSVSSVSTATPTFNSAVLAGPSTTIGNGFSPAKRTSVPFEHENASMTSWNQGLTNGLQTAQPKQFGHFPDGTPGEGWNNAPDSFSNNPLMNSRVPAGTSLWSSNVNARSGSIWNSATPAAPSHTPLWGAPALMDVRSSYSGGESPNDKIHVSAIQAMQILEKSNQGYFGVYPAVKVFQLTKEILTNPSLGMAEFLGALHSGGRYQFEVVYDNFGSVTHIMSKQQSAPAQVPSEQFQPGFNQGLQPPTPYQPLLLQANNTFLQPGQPAQPQGQPVQPVQPGQPGQAALGLDDPQGFFGRDQLKPYELFDSQGTNKMGFGQVNGGIW